MPGLYPHTLIAVDALDVRFDIRLTLPDDAETVTGWTDRTMHAYGLARDFVSIGPFYETRDGCGFTLDHKQAGARPTRAEMEAACVADVIVMQPPSAQAKLSLKAAQWV